MYSKEIIKGTLKPIIFKLLTENKKMYGYEITQRVKEITDEKIQITEGALYPLLHKLEAEGSVTTKKEMYGKRIRKYYTLTPEGLKTAHISINEFNDFIETMRTILNPNLSAGFGTA